MADDEKKIIVDEDWKARVQREREEARARKEAQPEAPEGDAEGEGPGQDAEGETTPFMGLVTFLATQTMFSLGLIADPGTRQAYVDLNQAHFLIESMKALHEKTQGNLEQDETDALTQGIAELERVFVVRTQQIQEAQLRQAGIDPQNPNLKTE